MSETCAVCHKGKGPIKCEVCGFSDNGSINRQFPIPEDTQNWIDTVVKPYRQQWEAKKREVELLAQLEESRKKEAQLTAQLEEAKKVQLSSQPLSSPHSPPLSTTNGFVWIKDGTLTMSSLMEDHEDINKINKLIDHKISFNNGKEHKEYAVLAGKRINHRNYLLAVSMKEPDEVTVLEAAIDENGQLLTGEYKGKNYYDILFDLLENVNLK